MWKYLKSFSFFLFLLSHHLIFPPPRTVEPEYAPVAGMMGAASLITGIFTGIVFQVREGMGGNMVVQQQKQQQQQPAATQCG